MRLFDVYTGAQVGDGQQVAGVQADVPRAGPDADRRGGGRGPRRGGRRRGAAVRRGPARRLMFVPDIVAAKRVIAGASFDFARQVAVMAIVNRTPDSFYDKGATFALDAAVAAVEPRPPRAPTGSTSAG